jgi:hypothetical protein
MSKCRVLNNQSIAREINASKILRLAKKKRESQLYLSFSQPDNSDVSPFSRNLLTISAETPLTNILRSPAAVVPSSSGFNLDKTWSKVIGTADLAWTSLLVEALVELEVHCEPLEPKERCGIGRPGAEETFLFRSVGVTLSLRIVKCDGGKDLL